MAITFSPSEQMGSLATMQHNTVSFVKFLLIRHSVQQNDNNLLHEDYKVDSCIHNVWNCYIFHFCQNGCIQIGQINSLCQVT